MLNMINVKEDDIFLVHNLRVALTDKNKTVLFFKDGAYITTELECFVSLTRPVVKYLYNEGFVKAKSLKVTVLSK